MESAAAGADDSDAYGFPLQISEHERSERQASEAKAAEQNAAWQRYVDQQALPPRSKLKQLVRAGVPPSCRAWVWLEVAGATALRDAQPSTYVSDLIASDQPCKSVQQIELDLPRTYPKHPWLASPPGQLALRNVLTAFARHNVVTGYCQGLNFVAGLLLLVVGRNEEAAFWLLVALVEQILYSGSYADDLSGTHVEMRTLDDLIALKLPSLAAHLRDLPAGAFLFATDWFLCLFATSLPPESTVRVWDALFMEGSKVMFRVALAILKQHELAILAKDNAGEVLDVIKHAVQHTHQRDSLMTTAFDHIGSLPMDRINKLRRQNQTAVHAMLEERRHARQPPATQSAASAIHPTDTSQGMASRRAQGSPEGHAAGSTSLGTGASGHGSRPGGGWCGGCMRPNP